MPMMMLSTRRRPTHPRFSGAQLACCMGDTVDDAIATAEVAIRSIAGNDPRITTIVREFVSSACALRQQLGRNPSTTELVAIGARLVDRLKVDPTIKLSPAVALIVTAEMASLARAVKDKNICGTAAPTTPTAPATAEGGISSTTALMIAGGTLLGALILSRL